MAPIMVSAIVSDGLHALLARRSDGRWDLPGGMLRDDDPSVEDGLRRILLDEFGIEVQTEDFLDTYYEPVAGAAEPLVRNVSLIEAWSETGGRPGLGDFTEMRWVSLEDAGRLSLNSVAANALREGLGLRAEEPSRPGAPLLFITGPPAAGKSSVARALCSRLERAAHIEVDLIRHMVISGYASPIAGVSDPLAAAAQNELQTANVVALARNFSLTGFHTILDLLLEAPEDLDQYLEVLAETGSIYLVTLMPALATLQRRDEGRPPAVRQGERVEAAYRSISSKNEVRGLRIDNTGLDIERTVSQIITNLDQARVV